MRRILPALLVAALLVPLRAEAELTPEERRELERLAPDRVVRWTLRLSEEIAQRPSGAGFASAIAGSAEERALADAVAEALAGLGYAVVREPFPVRTFRYGDVRLLVDGEPIEAITLHSSGGTWGVRDGVPYSASADGDGTLRTALVDAGDGTAADYDALGSVEGKAALVRWRSWPGFAITEAATRGAAAVVFYDYPGPAVGDALRQNTVIGRDAIPALHIRLDDARRLVRRLEGGPLSFELTSRVDSELAVSENVVALRPGRERPDEWIAVSAHHDRWFRGAQDDAVGVGVLLEMARLWADRPNRRSLAFVSFGSEETGGIDVAYDWLTGSYAFVRRHPEIAASLVHALNVDGAGWTSARGYLYASIESLPFQRRLLDDLDLAGRVELVAGVTDWVDAWSLGPVGGGAVSYLLWFPYHSADVGPGSFASYYHTQLDRYRPEWYGNLADDLRLAALGLLRADAAVAPPVAPSELLRWASRAIEACRADVDRWARDLVPALDEAGREAGRLLRLAEALEAGSPGETSRADRRRIELRSRVKPWLLALSAEGATLRLVPPLRDLAALGEAGAALAEGRTDAAARALARVRSMDWGASLSPEAYERERLADRRRIDWSDEFGQRPPLLSPAVHSLYRRLLAHERGRPLDGARRDLEALAAEAHAHLADALWLVTGKLREARLSLAR